MEGEFQTDSQMFKRRLKHLYKKIDSVSSLLWSHDNHLTGKRLRSEINSEDTKLKWLNKETTQTGYGEIAMGSMTSLFNLMQNISKVIQTKMKIDPSTKEHLLYQPEDYNMTKDSLFLDIGSGFGKPVFHAALQVGCESKGIEVVPARVEFCMDFFYEFMDNKNFFEELEKKKANKQGNKSDDEELNVSNGTPSNNLSKEPSKQEIPSEKENKLSSFSSNSIHQQIKNNKVKIFHNEDGSSFVDCDVYFVNKIDMNTLNSSYYLDVLEDKSASLYLELRINPESVYEDNISNYIGINNMLYPFNKSFLVEEWNENSEKLLKFGRFFRFDQIMVDITPIDDHIYSNLANALTSSIYNHSIEREIFTMIKKEKLRNLSEIVEKIENPVMLDLIYYVNSVFKGKNSYLDLGFINPNTTKDTGHNNILSNNNKIFDKKSNSKSKANNNHKENFSNFSNALYEELKQSLRDKEKMIQELFYAKDEDESPAAKPMNEEKELQVLKEVLVDLKFAPYNDKWYSLSTFIAADATIYKHYAPEENSKKHYTHIYSYNKLMSKECRSKIAKILNKTKYKILAWYSNPKQTKKAGLKNFMFLSKFPMQSTSTEKFHVYVYIKTK